MSEPILMRAGRWLTCIFGYLLAGQLVGMGLDALLQKISHDYVWAPGQMQQGAIPISLFLGCFYGAACTSTAKAIALPRLMLGVLVAMSYTVFAALIVAVIRATTATPTGIELAPLKRVSFCEGLIWGAWIGGVLGTLIVVWYQYQPNRRKTVSN